MTPLMASDQHFRVQQAEAVPFFTPTKSSCEFSFEVSQDDVGGEDADDAEAGFLKQTGFTFLHDQCPKIKIIQHHFKRIPPKIHFFGSLESQKSSYPLTLSNCQDLRPGTVPSTIWSRSPWWPMWTAAKRAMTSNVGCGSFTANGTWGGVGCFGALGAGRGFFWRDFFSIKKGRYTCFERYTIWNEKGYESCRWITLSKNAFFQKFFMCHDVQLDFFSTLLTLWLLGDLCQMLP